MRIATVCVVVLVSMAVQGCKIEMPSLIKLIADYRSTEVKNPDPYDYSRSKAVALQGGFTKKIILGDNPEGRHGRFMLDIFTTAFIPEENILFDRKFPASSTWDGNRGLAALLLDESRIQREETRVITVPYLLVFMDKQDEERIKATDNILFIVSAGNANEAGGGRDLYNSEHPIWERASFKGHFENVIKARQTGKVLTATSAWVLETEEIVPHRVASCGDIKESCFTILPQQSTSGASAKLSSMAFYLSQLYATEEEVREALEVCAVDIGEPGIDREYGRGAANLLCPRVLEREIEIVSGYVTEEAQPFLTHGGNLTGTWKAETVPLEIYVPPALKETVQPKYHGTVNGTVRFGGRNKVEADFMLTAEVQTVFLMDIPATAEDAVQVEGEYTVENETLVLEGRTYAYTATEDSLILVRSVALNEALTLLPGPIGGLAKTVTKDLFADDPIKIITRFARVPTLLGDFDENNIVDFADFLVFVNAFGAMEGDPHYNGWLDLDGDGSIAFNDFLIFADAFSRTG